MREEYETAYGRVTDGLTVLFGHKPDWEHGFRSTLDTTFLPSFHRFSEANLREYDLVAPLVIEDYAALWHRQEEVLGRALFPSQDSVAICDDKKTFNSLIAARLSDEIIPKVYGSQDHLEFPLIAKKRSAEWGIGSKVISDPAEAEAARLDDGIILQRLVPGHREHTTHLLVQDYTIIYHFDVVFQMAGDRLVKGRDARGVEIVTGSCCQFLDVFEQVLRVVGFANGTCCIDYKVAGSGLQIFEMNPRFGASLWLDLNGYLRALCEGLRIPLA